MGLMGYARNTIRQHWHIYQVIQDTSVGAFSPGMGFAARVISVCVLLFLGLIGFIFWLSNIGENKESIAQEESHTSPIPAAVEPEPVPAAD